MFILEALAKLPSLKITMVRKPKKKHLLSLCLLCHTNTGHGSNST